MGKYNPIKTPFLTVDAIIELVDDDHKVVLFERKNTPHGIALPGGFVDYGESVENAVVREVKEETGLDFKIRELVGVYSDPSRDERMHTVSVVFTGEASGRPKAADDAKAIMVLDPEIEEVPDMVFDHGQIFLRYLDVHRY